MKSRTRTYGIIAGGGTILYLLLFYFFDKANIHNGAIVWSTVIIYVACMYKAVVEEKNALGGTIEFKEAVSPAFTVYLIANIMYYAFIYLMFKYFDPELVTIATDLSGDEQFKISLRVWDYVSMCLRGCIFGFGLSAILAIILKR